MYYFCTICVKLHLCIYLFLCLYVNKVGGPNLSQCRIGQLGKPVRTTVSVRNEHEMAISLVSLITLLTAVKPAASWKYTSRFSIPSMQSSDLQVQCSGEFSSPVSLSQRTRNFSTKIMASKSEIGLGVGLVLWCRYDSLHIHFDRSQHLYTCEAGLLRLADRRTPLYQGLYPYQHWNGR